MRQYKAFIMYNEDTFVACLSNCAKLYRGHSAIVRTRACSDLLCSKGDPSGFREEMIDLDTLVAGQQFHTTFSSKNLNWEKTEISKRTRVI